MERIKFYSRSFLLLFSLFLVGSCSKNDQVLTPTSQDNQSTEKSATISTGYTVFAENFSYPRGLKYGPDGYLYVALAGVGGTNLTSGCNQVVAPVGPYLGGNTASIIKISPKGKVSTVVDGLPSDVNALGSTSGVADVEFVGNQLYALVVAGCSHGNADYPSSIIKVNQKTGKWHVVADLSAYFLTHSVAHPEPDDFEPDGTPYSMVFVWGEFYVIEPNHGEMIRVSLNGKIKRVIDFSAYFGHIVPTSVAFKGNFFVGNLTVNPFVEGSANIFKVTPGGAVKIWETGFSTVLGVAFDKENRFYVLETSANGGFVPGTGRVVRINNDKSRDVIVDKLVFPTGIAFGPGGNLYISSAGFGPPTGQILKVDIKYHKDNDHDGHNGHFDN
jgi:hypothetical protein